MGLELVSWARLAGHQVAGTHLFLPRQCSQYKCESPHPAVYVSSRVEPSASCLYGDTSLTALRLRPFNLVSLILDRRNLMNTCVFLLPY